MNFFCLFNHSILPTLPIGGHLINQYRLHRVLAGAQSLNHSINQSINHLIIAYEENTNPLHRKFLSQSDG